MEESAYNFAAPTESPAADDASAPEPPPEFGLIDVIEAFTAMRHEWRGQTKESRALAESIRDAATNIQDLETKLLARIEERTGDEAERLVEVVADVDHQLTRALEAAEQSDAHRRRRKQAAAREMEEFFAGMSPLARWFARPLYTFVSQQIAAEQTAATSPAVEGLNLVLARLRRTMQELQIERLDAVGRAFDGTTMNAIGAVESHDYPSGHVAEQLSPGYCWRGRVLRFADVRVAS